jgi:hypothetical protein
MAQRFNPPPNWPAAPAGWTPPAGWKPDPTWGPPPPGWQLWIGDDSRHPMNKRPLKIIGGLVAALLLMGIGAALGGGGDTTQAAALTSRPTVTVTSETTVTAAARPNVTLTATATATVTKKVRTTVTAKPAAPRAQAASNCTPGYSPCLPPADDYDCAGGSGNGPEYADGPIAVTGSDPYGLDADGDGVACES